MLRPATTTAALAPNVMASRYLIGSRAQRIILEPVTKAPHCFQARPPEWPVDLLPQRSDVDVHDPGITVEGEVPDVLEQRAPGEHVAGPAHEEFKQRELSQSELDLARATAHLVPGRVERQVTHSENRGALSGLPAHERAKPREQLVQRERLDQVVVRSDVETMNAVSY